ncbi:EXS-domain-containing protein [Irpex rosettiformis]|uniref:EXS-domain-containing protein n=1 Tax=Irpex rosettiformis TaxID=378272 RepID=A0ACB8UFU6_9APHY|nr:EXS-domain-containing protein [Irpex rosettiformis]
MSENVSEEIKFSALFPLPFRVLFLGGLGILGWATNLHGLSLLGIDAAAALELNTHHQGQRQSGPDYSGTESTLPTSRAGWKAMADPSSVYGPIYKLFLQYSLATLIGWLLYRHATHGDVELVDVFKFVPAVTMLILTMALVSPFDVLGKRERDHFIHAVHRCFFSQTRIYFSDVVFADIFTSFAKVVGDVWLSVCMLLPGGSLLLPPTQDGYARWILPTFMSIPYAIRFRQCLVEYFMTNETKRPLYNAIKYATAFPVIYLSAAQRLVTTTPEATSYNYTSVLWYSEHPLFVMWLLAAAVNSLYSFWWDVTYDWGFDLLRPKPKVKSESRAHSPPRPLMLPRLHSRSAMLSRPGSEDSTKDPLMDKEATLEEQPFSEKPYPFGLRRTLLLPLAIYPFAIIADLILRLTWSAKLSSHLHSHIEGDRAIFLVEFAEMIRRWMWVFIRVEWELVKEREVRASLPPGTRMRRKAPDASIENEYELLSSRASSDAGRSAQE